MKKLKKLKLVNNPRGKILQQEESSSAGTTVISIKEQRKLQYYEKDNFMRCFRKQTDEEKRRAAMMVFSFYTRQLMEGELADYIVEEHFNLLGDNYKEYLIDFLNEGINKKERQGNKTLQ